MFWRLSAACLFVLQGLLTPLAASGFAPGQAAASSGPAIPRPPLSTATTTAAPTTAATAATPMATTLPATAPVTATVPATATIPATATASLSATATATATPILPLTATGTLTATPAASDTATAPALPLTATATPGDTAPAAGSVPSTDTIGSPASPAGTATARLLAALPLQFEENRGQTDPAVRYLARGPGYTLFLTAGEAVLTLSHPRTPGKGRHAAAGPDQAATDAVTGTAGTVLRLRYEGANAAPRVTGDDQLPGTVNYFIGDDPSRWQAGAPTVARVTYHDIYPNTDLVYYGTAGRLEYDFRLQPGADPGAIGFTVAGARGLRLDPDGGLVLDAPGGALVQRAPVAYQDVDGTRRPVESRYTLAGATVGFALGAYDTSKPVVIDPVLSYSTYLGGGYTDAGYGIAVDGAGAAYIVGQTNSAYFPTAGAIQGPNQGAPNTTSLTYDAFVTKLNPAGNALVYSTYLGGKNNDYGRGIAVDPQGDAYVTGYTGSPSFPTTANAYQAVFGGYSYDAFVAKLNPAGSALLYSSYLGGANSDYGYGIAADGAGNAYVAGTTLSSNFPITNAYQSTFGGGTGGDAFVARLDTTLSGAASLRYSTYLGGATYDDGLAIAADPAGAGAVYVTGDTAGGFPTKGALQGAYGGGTYDAYVAKLNTSASGGASLLYSSLLGGGSTDVGQGIAADIAGDAYVTGYTGSSNFPTASALQGAYNGGSGGDAFVAKVNPAGAGLVYSTYLGGSADDRGNAVAVDAGGNAYVTGYTNSTNFPARNAPQPALSGASYDAFVTKLNTSGSLLPYSTYLGGSGGDDIGTGIAVDGAGDAYVTGYTAATNFPTTNAFQAGYGGGDEDAFVAMVGTPSGSVPWHPHSGGAGSVGGGVGLSVDLADGHLDASLSGLNLPGRGPDIAIERSWDSSLAGAGGSGLASSVTPSMGGALTATVSYIDESGAVWPFVYGGNPAAAPPYTSYRTPAGQPWQLVAATSGYTLTNFLTGEVWTFDAQGRLLADADAYGNKNSLSYGSGSATSPSGVSNSGGRAAQLGYTNGQLGDARSPLWASSGGAQGQRVTYGYSGGQVTSLTRGAGSTDAVTTTFGYSGALLTGITTPANGVWGIGYDASGRVGTITSPASGTVGQAGYTPSYTTQYTYSPGRTVVVAGANTSAAVTTTYTLDAAGEATSVTDGLGDTTRSAYDADHDVTSSTDANGNTTTNKYQYIGPNGYAGAVGVSATVGQVVEEDQPAVQPYSPQNGVTVSPVITHTYDSTTHDLLATGQPEGGVTKYTYDGRHSVVATTEQTTQQTCATACSTTWRGTIDAYDGYGERTATTDGRGVAVDATGNATPAGPNGLYTSHTTYDAQGDVAGAGTPPITTTLNGITTTAPATTTYAYDGDGNQTSETSANGGVTSYAYDHLGRQVQVARPAVALYGASGSATSGAIATATGTGAAAYGGDGGPATAAAVRNPPGVALDGAGNLYIVDNGNNRIREVVAATGIITTVAGSGLGGYGGDGGPATSAMIKNPRSVAVDGGGNLYIADAGNNRVREVIAATGVITTVAGSGTAGYGGDGGAATSAMLKNPQGLALDSARNLYIADNGNNRVRRVAASGGTIATVAGNGYAGYGGDGGAATAAGLNGPQGLAVDASGNLYIADGANNRVREVVASSGVITTVVGTGLAGYGGDGGPATAATLNAPAGLALDAAGNLLIGDGGDNRVRELVAISGTIGTVAGTGVAGYAGDGGPAAGAALNAPSGVAVTGATTDTLYIADTANNRVRRVVNAQVAPLTSPTERTAYDALGNAASETDANGNTTTSGYDPLGRMVSQTNPVSGTSLMTYTAGELTAQQDPQGNVTGYGYDAVGRQVQVNNPVTGTVQTAYDAADNVVAVTTTDRTAGNAAVTVAQMGYDALDRAITSTVVTDTANIAGSALTTLTRYDLDGNVAQTQQPNGDVVYNVYDAADQVTNVEIDGAPICGKAPAATHASYEAYSYDGAGNVTFAQDADNRATTTQYDGDNRLAQSVAASAAPTGTTTITTTVGYDPDGNAVRETTQTADSAAPGQVQAHTVTNTYNAADWETSTTDDGYTTSYAYDAAGQQRTEGSGDGGTAATFGVDPEGRVTSVSENAGGAGPYTAAYTYTANDLPRAVSYPDGTSMSLVYDANSQLTGLTLAGPNTGAAATTLSTAYAYGYNAAGWTTGTTTISGTDTIAHDGAGRLTSDCGQQPIVRNTADHCYRWTYDNNGNVTSQVNDNGSTEAYTYSASQPNAVVRTTSLQATVPVTDRYKNTDTYYAYDGNGDTTAITSPVGGAYTDTAAINTRIQYDAEQRPITVTKLAVVNNNAVVPLTVTMGYNADGLRARYTARMSGTVTLDEQFRYRDGELASVSGVTATLNADGSAKSSGQYADAYVYGALGEPLELLRTANGQTARYWYALDGQGSVVALTDQGGKVVDRYTYDSWGEQVGRYAEGLADQQLRYRGYWYDSELEWYWATTRHYDAEALRWLQPDPSDIDGVHTYAYAADDPLDLDDPSGLNILTDVLGCGHWYDTFEPTKFYCVAYQEYQDYKALTNPNTPGLEKALIVVSYVPVPAAKGARAVRVVFAVLKGGRVVKLAGRAADVAVRGGRYVRVAYKGVRRFLGLASKCAACFPAGTQVDTPDGERAIQTIRVGQRVLAEDPKTGTVEPETVQAVIQDPVSELMAVDLSDGSAITATADHPFWVDGALFLHGSGWLEASQLQPGDRLRTASGHDVVVVGLRQHVGHAIVYTLTVARDHTFFVGSARVLVHNCTPPPLVIEQTQLQSKFKHAADFGVTGNWNPANGKAFADALEKHVNAPGTLHISGTYRGDPVIHNVDPSTGLDVIQDPSGKFISGWRLNPAQLNHVMTTGKLGGG